MLSTTDTLGIITAAADAQVAANHFTVVVVVVRYIAIENQSRNIVVDKLAAVVAAMVDSPSADVDHSSRRV